MARLVKASHRIHLAVLASAFALVVAVGGEVFAATQHLPFTTGLYWAITTATTVGYGDVVPHNASGRIVASAVMLTAIPILGALFAVVAGVSVSAGLRRIMQLDSNFPVGSYRLVVGMHPTVPAIVDELVKADDAVVLVADVDPTTMPEAVHVIRGLPTDPSVIRRAKPAGAQHALITAETDGDVLVSAVLLRQEAPGIPLTALTSSQSVRHALEALGVEQTVSADHLVAHTIAKSLETPHAGRLVEQLIDSEEHSLIEVPVEPETYGKPLSAVRRDRGGLVLGIVKGGSVDLGVVDDPEVSPGDRLLVAEPLGARGPSRVAS
jgi:voltage-gated potassium channel